MIEEQQKEVQEIHTYFSEENRVIKWKEYYDYIRSDVQLAYEGCDQEGCKQNKYVCPHAKKQWDLDWDTEYKKDLESTLIRHKHEIEVEQTDNCAFCTARPHMWTKEFGIVCYDCYIQKKDIQNKSKNL